MLKNAENRPNHVGGIWGDRERDQNTLCACTEFSRIYADVFLKTSQILINENNDDFKVLRNIFVVKTGKIKNHQCEAVPWFRGWLPACLAHPVSTLKLCLMACVVP